MIVLGGPCFTVFNHTGWATFELRSRMKSRVASLCNVSDTTLPDSNRVASVCYEVGFIALLADLHWPRIVDPMMVSSMIGGIALWWDHSVTHQFVLPAPATGFNSLCRIHECHRVTEGINWTLLRKKKFKKNRAEVSTVSLIPMTSRCDQLRTFVLFIQQSIMSKCWGYHQVNLGPLLGPVETYILAA